MRADEGGRELYAAAVARERAVRATFSGTPSPDVVLKDIHTIVTAYQTVVRRFPSSGYADNALWQAGRLELDAFARFGTPSDREAGVRLLRRLEAEYPASARSKRVRDVLASIEKPHVTAPAVVPAARSAPAATLKTIQRTALPDVVRVVIELDAEVPFHDERVANPDRLLIDLAAARAAPSLTEQTIRFAGDSDIVRQVRIGQQSRAARVTLDAAGVSTYSVYALYNPFRLVVDCVRASHPAPTAPPLAADTLVLAAGRFLPRPPAHATTMQLALAATESTEPPVTAPVASVASARESTRPERNTTGGFSIARQLGLGVSRIVIDPGHGGHDPGAMGHGVSEAELVLDIALRLEKLLQKQPGTDVVLTRRTDDFVSLPERTAIANREGADLFLSIHANASEDASARGVETYFLNFANNLSAASVAARENAASGQSMGALPDFVKAIALNNKLDESRDFATDVQRSMIERLRTANKTTKDLGVKQAPFVVLIGAAMPSVLAEISFVTNPQEARLLKSSAFRQRIADALFTAIRKYQSSLRTVGTVAHRSQ